MEFGTLYGAILPQFVCLLKVIAIKNSILNARKGGYEEYISFKSCICPDEGAGRCWQKSSGAVSVQGL